jgi:hypothetical protein
MLACTTEHTRLMRMEVMICFLVHSDLWLKFVVPAVCYGVSDLLFLYQSAAYGGWGDYSTYLSHDGAETPIAVSAPLHT